MGNDYLAALAAKLTWNGAWNLRSTVTNPCPLNPNAIHGKGRTYTGMGKWTTIAAIGVENHLKSLGFAENSPRMDWGGYHTWITPLGREMAAYLDKHWDDVRDNFREKSSR